MFLAAVKLYLSLLNHLLIMSLKFFTYFRKTTNSSLWLVYFTSFRLSEKSPCLWDTSSFMGYLIVYGLPHRLWDTSSFMGYIIVYGIPHGLWDTSSFMGYLMVYGIPHTLWVTSWFMGYIRIKLGLNYLQNMQNNSFKTKCNIYWIDLI